MLPHYLQHALNVALVLIGAGFGAWCLLDWIGAFPEDIPLHSGVTRPEEQPSVAPEWSGESFVADAPRSHAGAEHLGPEGTAPALFYERETV
jgi:hypothetical protein